MNTDIDIFHECFIFIDSEGNKSLRVDSLEDLDSIDYIVKAKYNNVTYASICHVDIRTFFDNEGSARNCARNICIKNLRDKLCIS